MSTVFGRFRRIRKHAHKCPFTEIGLTITERGYIPALAENPLKKQDDLLYNGSTNLS